MKNQIIDQRTILHLKYVSDELAEEPTLEGVRTGVSMLIRAKTLLDGRQVVTASVSERFHASRASGKVYKRWSPRMSLSIRRTQQDLVIARLFIPSQHRVRPTHLFAADEIAHMVGQISGDFRTTLAALKTSTGTPLRALEGPNPTDWDQLGYRRVPHKLDSLWDEAQQGAVDHIGAIASFQQRFPMLQEGHRRDSPSVYMPYLDAVDPARVAKNLFGITRYRKPLGKQVARLGPGEHLAWFALFRGLVPIDWIIEAMDRSGPHSRQMHLTALERNTIRAILRRTPTPVLRRILAEPMVQSQMVLRDAAGWVGNFLMSLRDLSLLPGLIAARGQKRIRSSRDLEQLILAIPDQRVYREASMTRAFRAASVMDQERHELRLMEQYNETVAAVGDAQFTQADWEMWKDPAFRRRAQEVVDQHERELMTARQREQAERAEQRRLERIAAEKERATWAAEQTHLLQDLAVGEDLRVHVATEEATLSQWGQLMNNCIGMYSRDLGLDILAAVVDERGEMLLNLQITHTQGLVQLLGKNNRDAADAIGRTRAQTVLDALVAQDIAAAPHTLGLNGLTQPITA